ncbi:helix-turn-helix transcriptional regulator [Marinigracilibium pacificum]|uniref:helix-turn-helix transcriptional regulator n=1 Tax=Marinigracilibium pacificum TaxID=2729599 RepID=UPI0038CC083B
MGIFFVFITIFIPERVYFSFLSLYLYPKGYKIIMEKLSQFVKERRKKLGLTQEDLSFKAGVGLRFVRDLEQGKKSLMIDKVNQVLSLFGHELGPIPTERNEDR